MLPEGVRRVGGPAGQVAGEVCLLAQRLPGPDPGGLLALGVPDLARRCQDLPGVLSGDEQHAVVVAEDNVVAGDQVRPEPAPWSAPRAPDRPAAADPAGSRRS